MKRRMVQYNFFSAYSNHNLKFSDIMSEYQRKKTLRVFALYSPVCFPVQRYRSFGMARGILIGEGWRLSYFRWELVSVCGFRFKIYWLRISCITTFSYDLIQLYGSTKQLHRHQSFNVKLLGNERFFHKRVLGFIVPSRFQGASTTIITICSLCYINYNNYSDNYRYSFLNVLSEARMWKTTNFRVPGVGKLINVSPNR